MSNLYDRFIQRILIAEKYINSIMSRPALSEKIWLDNSPKEIFPIELIKLQDDFYLSNFWFDRYMFKVSKTEDSLVKQSYLKNMGILNKRMNKTFGYISLIKEKYNSEVNLGFFRENIKDSFMFHNLISNFDDWNRFVRFLRLTSTLEDFLKKEDYENALSIKKDLEKFAENFQGNINILT